jgi:hypothetical protein
MALEEYKRVIHPSLIHVGEVYYLKRGELPPTGERPEDPKRKFVPVRIIDLNTIEFLDSDCAGHTANGKVPSGLGWNIDVKKYATIYFYIKKGGETSNKITVKKGDLKGKRGDVLRRFNGVALVKFGEDVGGYSLDGIHPKGTCLFIEDSYLRFHKPSKPKKEKSKPKEDRPEERYGLRNLTRRKAIPGVRVVLMTSRHGNSEINPVWRGVHSTLGTIDSYNKNEELPVYVNWDNDRSNCYLLNDLCAAVQLD